MENEGDNGALTVGDKRRPEKLRRDKREGREKRQHVRREEKERFQERIGVEKRDQKRGNEARGEKTMLDET